MEADWQVEIGGDAAVMDAAWPESLDLVVQPELASALPEAKELPGLAELLIALNGRGGAFRTSKCDVWTLANEPPEQIDPYEFDATVEESAVGVACYVDLLPRNPETGLEVLLAWARAVVVQLRAVSLKAARVDLVLRQAVWESGEGVGITLYAASCGSKDAAARERLTAVLARLAEVLSGLPLEGQGCIESDTGVEGDSSLK